MDNISEARLIGLHPVLQDKARQFVDQCDAEGITVRITQGYRSYNEQLELWQKGRDEHGNIINPSLVVTHARPGYSWHSYGMAFDFCPMVNGIPEWGNPPLWDRCIAIGEGLGLFSGSRWAAPQTDRPHFQLTGRFPEAPDNEVLEIMATSGLAQLWIDSGIEQA